MKKEKPIKITMTLSRPQLALLMILLFSAFIFGHHQYPDSIDLQRSAPEFRFHSSAILQDTTRPEIYDWGLDNSVNPISAFTVWANVTDYGSGIHNVTALLRQDSNTPVTSLMTFNGTLYTTTFPAVESNHTYSVWVQSYDEAGNIASSYNRQFDLRINLHPPIPVEATAPYVVSSSLLVLVLAIGLSYEYNKRHPRDELGNDLDNQEIADAEESPQ
ncbi:MAG: hypothetical protein P1Q69_06320 [Candidatus Thorarchaeota archaeon]|nr:hypothetical protein [Candidatus Thorarchaeota archaeon]